MSYLPTQRTPTLDSAKLSDGKVSVSCFNPRTGQAASKVSITDQKRQVFELPAEGDRVLGPDDADKKSSDPRTQSIKPCSPLSESDC